MGGSTSRNALCPCGSGEKFKRCCLATAGRRARSARADDEVARRLQAWSADALRDEIGLALAEFAETPGTVHDDEVMVFATWFHNDRRLSDGRTPAERYAALPHLAPDERMTAERIAASRLGVHRVLEVRAGLSVVVEPLLGGARLEVESDNVSRQATRWDILLGRIMPGDPLTFFGPAALLRPDEETELREELARLSGSPVEDLDADALADTFEGSALELMRFVPASRTAEPCYFTLEGDPVAFATATWKVRDLAATEQRLRSLGGLDPDEPTELDITARRAHLVSQRPELPPGAIVLESSPVGDPGTISLADLRLEGDRLHAEAISVERIDTTIEIVSEDFGDLVELVSRDVRPLDEARRESRKGRRLRLPLPHRDRLEEELGAAAMSARMMLWLDEPNQALGGGTPRDAVKGPRRDDVVRLLRQLENNGLRAQRDGLRWFDTALLRAELGLDDELAA